MSFPLFRRPGSVVFLDDDPDYLDMLAMVMPKRWHIRLHMRPSHCIHSLHREPPLWEIDAWNQQQMVDQWRQGAPLIPQILGYWARSEARYALTRVVVVDFSMPEMDGLQVLGELTEWQGSRVMLTGQADEQVAVKAFNRGLIEQFVPKQLPEMGKRLISALETLLAQPHARHSQTWRATLKPEQYALLRAPAVQEALSDFAATRWVDHVTLGDPFGILGMDEEGNVSWLQLEMRDGLAALAEVAEIAGVPEEGLAEIRNGRKLVSMELRQALGLDGPCDLIPAFSPGGDPALLAAVFQIPAAQLPAPITGYREWLSRQEARKVED